MRWLISASILVASTGSALEAAPPQPRDQQAWLGKREVPPGILKRGERVQIVVALAVSAEGRAAGCTIIQSSGHSALDDHACELYRQRARFRPARDADGEVIAGTYETGAKWEAFKTAIDAETSKATAPEPDANVGRWVTTDDLPKGLLTRDEVVASDLALTVSPDGVVTTCRVSKPSAKPVLDRRACELVIARAHYKPAHDAAGMPIEAIDWHRVRWQEPRD